jgi:hypothetical protein
LVASDSGIFSFGDAGFFGSIPGLSIAPAGTGGTGRNLNAPIVGMVPSSDGGGYFLVASDGGVFAFGDAKFKGSCPSIGGCAGAAVTVMPDGSGNGSWLITASGHVYSFGDATNDGQPGPQSSLVTSAVRTPDGGGYWILFANGAVSAFGEAVNLGSPLSATSTHDPTTAIFSTADGGGYWVSSAVGAVFAYGDAPNLGSLTSQRLNGSIVAGTGFRPRPRPSPLCLAILVGYSQVRGGDNQMEAPSTWPRSVAARLRITPRSLQIALGLLWIFDGLLKLQPNLLRPSFVANVISPMAAGQPGLVGSSITHMANFLSHEATMWVALFGLVEIAIGAAMLSRRTVKPALVASFIWGAGIYLFGEGFGMVLTGHTSPLVGAPGAVCFYVLLGVMVWPKNEENPGRMRVGADSVGRRTRRLRWHGRAAGMGGYLDL